MPKTPLKDIQAASFRANPNYELVLFDRLSTAQQQALKELQEDPDLYGVLLPRPGEGLGVKSVDQDTALLLFTLQTPGRPPEFARAKLGERCNQTLAELVLDGVLEIEDAGAFVSGSAAQAAIFAETVSDTAHGRIAELSLAALRYGQALEMDDVQQLSMRLYSFNSLPLSPAWQRCFETPDKVAAYLGIDRGGACRAILDRHWSQPSPAPGNDPWFYWTSRNKVSRAARPSSVTYKLYVSPATASIREGLRLFLEASATLGALSFKVGCAVHGLLRPDKLVAYFASFEELARAADVLRQGLAGVPAHGVPFSAGISPDGLLSWGIDPPRAAQTSLGHVGESWRVWITNHLAQALVQARASPAAAVEPWQFALERLQLEGVDTGTWTPASQMWHEYTALKE